MDRAAVTELIGQRIGVLGLAVNNQSLVTWLLAAGATNLTICDQNPAVRAAHPDWEGRVRWRLGPDYLDHLTDFQIVFRTPGIAYLLPEIQQAKAAGVVISSQTKLFFALSPAKIIGVTGTKGKGTTASLIFEILKNQREARSQKSGARSQEPELGQVYLAGNIGRDPFEFLDRLAPDDWVVLELSSFQLQDLTQGPQIAVVLEITSDHLDHHLTREEYVAAKAQILLTQRARDAAVLHADSATVNDLVAAAPAAVWQFSRTRAVARGAYVNWPASSTNPESGEIILCTEDGTEYPLGSVADMRLRGRHNLDNITAAATAAYLAGADPATIAAAIRSFRGLAHRLELIGEWSGRTFYNDSFATGPDPVLAALASFSEPIHLIVGGASKGADFTELARVIAHQSTVRTLIPLGVQEGRRIAAAVADHQPPAHLTIAPSASTMEEAVRTAVAASQPGEVILLSPGAASFDLFTDYKARGAAFTAAVTELIGRSGR